MKTLIYNKEISSGTYMILILYVDDMLIGCKNKDELSMLKKNLRRTFDMKNWEMQNTFLASILLAVGVMNVFICLNLIMYPKYSYGE